MNIFVLDTDQAKCARYHCDQHVVKMILESAQILCTVLSKKGLETPYRPTHTSHPCVLWAEESCSNFRWLLRLAECLNDEYKYRYNRSEDHESINVVKQISQFKYEDTGLTEFAQAMPEKYRLPGDAVTAYRRYYAGEKMSFARWTRRRRPTWLKGPN